MNITPNLLSSTSIAGTNVKNPSGENIGEIKDLMVDWSTGQVAYAVLSFGGFLGMGDKLFAIPLEAFEFDTADAEDRIVLDVDKNFLDDAPGFDKDNWPNTADHEFTRNVYSHYDVEYKF
ncbi:PRC-barrel domain containing protein [Cryomorpha ignava]|uniref:PRC-barrel domain containing protein n=1 Tax=Cryomorpha ignava TaxID=101383 RepID=A0A7K3WRW2_9FLAO|nr:PRC-barrel domain-containing protein [Cryomorpha ignava]NEN24224.1 PRC-barrel domain containing protein [Cryomorpha ignava]